MSDMLLRVDLPAAGEPPEVGATRSCEVDRVRAAGGVVDVVVAAPGTRTVAVDLPTWALGKQRKTPPPWDADTDVLHRELVDVLTEVTSDERSSDLVSTMTRWLGAHGSDALHLDEVATVDAVPLLAAVLALDEVGEHDTDGARGALCRDLAVRLCRHLGLRATRCRHVEPVVTRWLNGEPTFEDLWRRLDWMPLTAAISVVQREVIQSVDQGIRARAAVRPEPYLTAVSGSLAAAVGLPADYDEVAALSRDLGVLNGLARALTPHAG
jgi:hypothetical protein